MVWRPKNNEESHVIFLSMFLHRIVTFCLFPLSGISFQFKCSETELLYDDVIGDIPNQASCCERSDCTLKQAQQSRHKMNSKGFRKPILMHSGTISLLVPQKMVPDRRYIASRGSVAKMDVQL